MKTLLTILFAVFSFSCFGQEKESDYASYDLIIPYKPSVISILADTGIFSSSINTGNTQKTTYISIKPGQYKIQVSGEGQTTFIMDSIVVNKGQQLVLNFTYNGPCLYDHPIGYIPICPKKHSDNIIPMVYGLISTRIDEFIKNKKDMKVKYAGCVTTNCNPQFYCKQHGIEF